MASDLREKFENYLVLNRLSAKTQEAYLKAVEDLAFYYNQSPDRLTDEQIQGYLLYLIRHRKLKWGSCNVAFSALCCFYKKFLKRDKTQFSILMWFNRHRHYRLPPVRQRQNGQHQATGKDQSHDLIRARLAFNQSCPVMKYLYRSDPVASCVRCDL